MLSWHCGHLGAGVSDLVKHRYERFRKIGTFEELSQEEIEARLTKKVDIPKREKVSKRSD